MCDELFVRLSKSNFRSRFHLTEKDRVYIKEKGWDTIRRHAADFVQKRLSPPARLLKNDGKQTPMRGHPVFAAQHACACCCRQCLYKWHHIDPEHWLTETEQTEIVNILMSWLKREAADKLHII